MKSIFAYFASTIDIALQPASVSFHCQQRRVDLLPVLDIETTTGKIVSCGGHEILPSSQKYYRLHLFQQSESFPQHLQPKLTYLRCFFGYGIRQSFSSRRQFLVHPHVVVTGLETIEQLFCGYFQSLLPLLLVRAGAGEITLHPSSDEAPITYDHKALREMDEKGWYG